MHGSAGGAHSGLAWSCGDGKWTDPILSKPPPAPRSACSLAFPQSENLAGRLQLVSTCTLLLPGLSVHLVHSPAGRHIWLSCKWLPLTFQFKCGCGYWIETLFAHFFVYLFYRTRVRSLFTLVTSSLTDSLTNSLLFSKLD